MKKNQKNNLIAFKSINYKDLEQYTDLLKMPQIPPLYIFTKLYRYIRAQYTVNDIKLNFPQRERGPSFSMSIN